MKISTRWTVRALACALAASVLSAAPAAIARADDTAVALSSLREKVGPSIVTVKYILKVEGGGQMSEMFGGDEGREMEISGLVIEDSGLILTSNTYLGGALAAMRGITANPTQIKVFVGDDTEGLSARVLARDSDLDLAWIKIDDPKASGKTFPAIDLASSAKPAVGDQLFGVVRMGKFFDHALVVDEGRLGGTTRKPRSLLIPSDLNPELGMPVFDKGGKLVGVFVLQMPNREDMEGGDAEGMRGSTQVLVLAADEVVKATARGKELAAQNPPEEAAPETPAQKPADPK